MPSILQSYPKNVTVFPEPFTPTSFSPYGTAIASPLPRDLSTIPLLPSLEPSPHVPAPVVANQSTALKYSPISPFQDEYSGRCPSGKPSEPKMSMFCCFPRQLRGVQLSGSAMSTPTFPRGRNNHGAVFDVRILERHPFTSQTFIPVDLQSSQVRTDEDEPVFLVIVAPSLKGEVATVTVPVENGEENQTQKQGFRVTTIRDPPDLRNLKAFVARGGQAVTYGPGTWHAPMVVLGKRRVDFVVVQFANGVGEEDCQEVAFGDGVVVDLSSVGGGGRSVKL